MFTIDIKSVLKGKLKLQSRKILRQMKPNLRHGHVNDLKPSMFILFYFFYTINCNKLNISILILINRDFNLEKKIEALPSLSLEEFQEKKKQQRTKKKKLPQKLNTNSIAKRTLVNQNNNGQLDTSINNRKEINDINSHEESNNAHLVGSQKRKARKQSITRNASAIVSKNSTQETNQRKYINSIITIFYINIIIINK